MFFFGVRKWKLTCGHKRISGRHCSPPEKQRPRTRTAKQFPWRNTFCFDVGQSDERREYSSSDSSRPRALACLRLWRELNTLWKVNFTTITRFPATLNATITTGWQQHATASWEATTGNTSVSAGYHTRIRCNAKKNNKKNKWSNDEVLIKQLYTFVQYQTQLHECIFSR